MKLEVLLSALNLKFENLEKMNIKSDCIVINQCGKNDYLEYKNFKIYSSDEIGVSNSRNKGLKYITGDIILLCDDDVIYNDSYEKNVIEEFEKNSDADFIVFNIDSPNRAIKHNTKNKRLHFYNILRYTSTRIAFKKESIDKSKIEFNNLFGPGAKYTSGEDTLFLVSALKNKLKIYSSTKNLGTVYHSKSTWFEGYNEEYFFNKGALFTAISPKFRLFLILQYLLRHREVLKNINFFMALKLMWQGSKQYIKDCKE